MNTDTTEKTPGPVIDVSKPHAPKVPVADSWDIAGEKNPWGDTGAKIEQPYQIPTKARDR